MRIAIIAGTRPEVIKLASVHRELSRSPSFEPFFISTGQHREMLDQALAAFELRPDLDLGLMQPNQSLSELTSRAVQAVTQALAATQPSVVLVQGDTTTVLASAMAATYARIPIGHVEAGLRTYDLAAPWPEEMNRRLTAPLCRWAFAPTDVARQNLLQERIPEESIHVTGNTVIDSLLWTRDRVRANNESYDSLTRRLHIPVEFAHRFLGDGRAPWILVTGHRRESFGEGFESICSAIRSLVTCDESVGVLYPVHLNPNVREPVQRLLGNHPRIALIEPVGYEDFVTLMDRCYFILTDSGGVQEEAPSLGKPVLVMRDTTERPEGVAAGTSRLVGTSQEAILRESLLLLRDRNEYARRSAIANPYGDGQAAKRIRSILERDLSGRAS